MTDRYPEDWPDWWRLLSPEERQNLAQYATIRLVRYYGEYRCFVCQDVMPSWKERDHTLEDYLTTAYRKVAKTVPGLTGNLDISPHTVDAMLDAKHYGEHGLTDKNRYNDNNPTLTMGRIVELDDDLAGLQFGDEISPAFNDAERCIMTIREQYRCGIRVESAGDLYCRAHP